LSSSKPLPANDLASIVRAVDWEPLRGKRVLFTGGSGFIGRWMMDSGWDAMCPTGKAAKLMRMNRDYYTDHELFRATCRCFSPEFIVHLAAPTDRHDQAAPEVIRRLTKWTCECAIEVGARLLHASSGCVVHVEQRARYGAFAEAKTDAEKMVNEVGGINARVGTVYGGGMRLDRGYAIGSFISDAQSVFDGGWIRVDSPLSRRHFGYISDVVSELWELLLGSYRGRPHVGTFDITSGETASMVEAASIVAAEFGISQLRIGDEPPKHYVPPITHSGQNQVSLVDGIKKTVDWFRSSDVFPVGAS
jgi:nucleoside-diphosphate-sugar epimerase